MPADDRSAIGALKDATARIVALQAALQAEQHGPVRLVETHVSWVLLTDTLAYKLKKPLRLPFLDFSSLAARRHFCEEELRVNRRLAPSLYLDVVELRDSARGPVFGGAGELLDVAVRMRRFDDGALWSERALHDSLLPAQIDAMAHRLASFHGEAAIAPPDSEFGSSALHRQVTRGLVDGLDTWLRGAGAAGDGFDSQALRAWLPLQIGHLAAFFDQRRRAGRVRECHGDLHLANLLQNGDDATAFDALEFDPQLRWIDPLHDIAFVVMDLMAFRQEPLAWRFLSAYLDASGDHEGLPGLRFFLVSRALVRAQVAALRSSPGQTPAVRQAATGPTAWDYLRLAARLTAPPVAWMAITHGLPGSGKSFFSQQLLQSIGALRVRSDVERKRLFGLAALQSSREQVPGGIYDSASTQRTYARLLDVARLAAGGGWPLIVDAAFARAGERRAFRDHAQARGLAFAIIECRAPLPVLRQRLLQRRAGGGDPSEADVEVLERLRSADEPLQPQEWMQALDVEADLSNTPAELSRRLRDLLSRGGRGDTTQPPGTPPQQPPEPGVHESWPK